MREEGLSMAEEVEWFVGIDWASQCHQICLVDAHKPFNLFRHVQDLSRVTHIRAAATSVNPCTGARSATSHGTSVAADLPGRLAHSMPSGAVHVRD